jgi:hypothetical protein
LADVELSTGKSSKERVRRKWLSKYVAANEEVVNISPTINHAHNGVDESAAGVLGSFSLTTLDGNVAGVG